MCDLRHCGTLTHVLVSDYPTQDCSIARALEVVGERWTLLIIREALLGTSRHDEFLERLGLPTNTLAKRLARLQEEGILEARPYQQHPVRHEYVLTPKGRELAIVVEALREWGDAHMAPDGPPADVRHRDCNGPVEVRLLCTRCGEPLKAPDLVHRHRPRR